MYEPKDGFTSMTFVIPIELKRKLKASCAIKGITLREIVTKTLERDLDINETLDIESPDLPESIKKDSMKG
jgi:hypothetical protein